MISRILTKQGLSKSLLWKRNLFAFSSELSLLQRSRSSLALSESQFQRLLSRNSIRVQNDYLEIGQHVEVDDEVVVLETGKSDAKVRSTHKGVITGFLFKEGDVVKIGEPLFEVDTEGKASSSDSAAKPNEAPKQEASQKESPTKKAETTQAQASPSQSKPAEKTGKLIMNTRRSKGQGTRERTCRRQGCTRRHYQIQ